MARNSDFWDFWALSPLLTNVGENIGKIARYEAKSHQRDFV